MTSDLAGARGRLETAAGAVDIYRLDRLADRIGDLARLPQDRPDPAREPAAARRLARRLRRRRARARRLARPGRRHRVHAGPRADAGLHRRARRSWTWPRCAAPTAARRRRPARRSTRSIPVDLVIDHSVQVDLFRTPEALRRATSSSSTGATPSGTRLLRWAQQAFDGLRVVPPGAGICHQVNLEHLGQVVTVRDGVAFPDTVVGTDSHTTMINGLGVLGWGVGGIEAEAAMLGQPMFLPQPLVIGVRTIGALARRARPPPTWCSRSPRCSARTAWSGKFVEFFGDGLSSLSIADRATLSNMCPEYGATAVLLPGRRRDAALPDVHGPRRPRRPRRALHEGAGALPRRRRSRADVQRGPRPGSVRRRAVDGRAEAAAGPRGAARTCGGRSSRRSAITPSPTRRATEIGRFVAEGGTPAPGCVCRATADVTTDARRRARRSATASVVIAAITSLHEHLEPQRDGGRGAAGAARRSRPASQTKPWVKTSLAPGSRVVTDYLDRAGLTPYLDKLGFALVGYGCTTCIGNSGPLIDEVAARGRRARPERRGRALGQPELRGAGPSAGSRHLPRLAAARASRTRWQAASTSTSRPSRSVRAPTARCSSADIWPAPEEVRDAVAAVDHRGPVRRREYGRIWDGDEHWRELPTPDRTRSTTWDPASTYVQEPPFFDGPRRRRRRWATSRAHASW